MRRRTTTQPVLDVLDQELAQPERARLATDQRDVVDAERVLERREPVELIEHRVGVEAAADLDHEAQAVRQVGVVVHRRDALELLALDRVLDLLDHLLRPDQVGQLGDHDALAARGDVLDAGRGPDAERAAPGRVRVADAVEPDDLAAGREVRAGHEAHEVVERGVGVGDQVAGCADHLDQVVRRHVRRHADRDARRAVDQEVRERGRQHLGLGAGVVVRRDEVDDVLVQPVDHEQRRRRQPRLGVPRRSRTAVQRSEIPVPVDQRDPHRERLGLADQGVVDRGVAVRVELAHDVADDAGALDVAALRPQAHLGHLEQDPALDRLQAVAGIGQRAGVDHRVGVLEERPLHLLRDVDVEDALGEVPGWRRCGGTSCHVRAYSSDGRAGTPHSPVPGRRIGAASTARRRAPWLGSPGLGAGPGPSSPARRIRSRDSSAVSSWVVWIDLMCPAVLPATEIAAAVSASGASKMNTMSLAPSVKYSSCSVPPAFSTSPLIASLRFCGFCTSVRHASAV